MPFLTFVKAIREPFLIAFTTASSEAALPKALEVMERFGVPKNIVGFVLPTGYSFNLDGTTLYLSLASVFVAQLAGVHDDVRPAAGDDADADADEQGRGRRAARARSSCSRRRSTQFGLPLEGAAILLGIDQIMDMGRTAVNVMGNCIATAVVARWEGVFDDERMRAFAAAVRPGRLMRIAVVGARGQLGAAVVHELPRRARRDRASTAPSSTSPTMRAVAAAMARAAARRRSSTARRTTTWTPPRIIRSTR